MFGWILDSCLRHRSKKCDILSVVLIFSPQIGSFIMDNEIDDDQDLEPSKFLLPTEGMETANIPSIDPETHARLEALLEAAGKYAQMSADTWQ